MFGALLKHYGDDIVIEEDIYAERHTTQKAKDYFSRMDSKIDLMQQGGKIHGAFSGKDVLNLFNVFNNINRHRCANGG